LKLLKYGITYGQKKKGEAEQSNKSIKFSIGYDGLPFQILFQRNPSEANDNLALGDILKLHTDCKNDIAVFDRGMQDRQKLAGLSENAQFFVTRLKVDFKFKVVPETNIQKLSEKTETLQLISEQKVRWKS
jgi:hypothetical protein